MKAVAHRIGCAIAMVPTYLQTLGLAGGAVVGPFLFLLPALAITLLGAFLTRFGGFAAGWDLQTAAFGMVVALVVMAITLWLSRLQHIVVARAAAALYLLAGLAFVAIEANTGASTKLGVWPTSLSPFMDALWFMWGLVTSFVGWVMLLWQLSLFPVVGNALMSPDMEHERARAEDGSAYAQGPGKPAAAPSRVVKPRRKLDDMAGMAELKQQLREFASHFEHYGKRNRQISDVNGLLLGGPPGNGKTVFAEALAGELGFGFLKVGVKDLASQWINETPTRIAEAFAEAVTHAPCVLFLDEIDAVARDRGGNAQNQHGEDIKAVNALLQEIDNARRHQVVLVAASNFVDRLDQALVRPGRFDVKIEIPLPDVEARAGILSAMLEKVGLKPQDGVVLTVAKLWERRSAAFIESTVKRLRQDMQKASRHIVTAADLKEAARVASRREGAIPKTGTPLSKLVLPAGTRREAESIVYRLKNWEALAERGGTPPTGVLLYGPPGTGKTNLVRAIALELGDWHVFEVKVAQMLADPQSFDKVLAQASEHRPAIVFLDEADDLLRDRSYSSNATATNEILKAMDGMMGAVPEVVFFAATNSPDAIDAAAKRGGRFTEKIFMDLLEGEDLVEFAQSELGRRKATEFAEDVSAQWIASSLGPIGPADLVAVISKAINATLTSAEHRPIERAEVIAAYTSILERHPPGAD